MELQADEDAEYSEIIELDLSEIEPMIAQPYSPDNVISVKELQGMKVDQICIGSCTNSSYKIMKTVASILRDKTVHEEVTLFINPGSRQVYEMLASDGSVKTMIQAGARLLESACGPCIGMGAAPGSGQISLRSYNRNFKGRSGTRMLWFILHLLLSVLLHQCTVKLLIHLRLILILKIYQSLKVL